MFIMVRLISVIHDQSGNGFYRIIIKCYPVLVIAKFGHINYRIGQFIVNRHITGQYRYLGLRSGVSDLHQAGAATAHATAHAKPHGA